MKLLVKAGVVFDKGIGVLWFSGCVLLALLMLAITYDVMVRYFFKHVTMWVFELSEISILYMTFLGTAYLLKEEAHVKMDMVLNRLNPRTQALINLITSIPVAIVCLIVSWYGIEVTWDYYQQGNYSLGLLRLPLWPIIVIVPVGFLLLSIQFLRRIYGNLGKWRALRNSDYSEKH
ncbi:TRAP transporter small permease [Chloroflexota bacterium]